MDRFIDAYNEGRRVAALDFQKEANAKDVAALIKALGEGASAGATGLGKVLRSAAGGAEVTGHGAKYLGTSADPRIALALGGGAALASSLMPGMAAFRDHGLAEALKAGLPGAIASLGAGVAVGANPGMLGGSAINRFTHELAMSSATPAGTIASMAALVGVPAALIGYGKKKGREENSLF